MEFQNCILIFLLFVAPVSLARMSAAQLSQLGRSRAGIRVSRATFPRTCRAGAHSGGRALCLCVSVGACAARACMQSSGTIRSSSNSRVTMRPRQSGRQAEAGDGGAPAPSPEDHATASDIQRSASSRHRTHSMGLSRYSRYSHYKEVRPVPRSLRDSIVRPLKRLSNKVCRG